MNTRRGQCDFIFYDCCFFPQVETLQLELEQAQERIAELETELNAYKDEASGKINPETGEVTVKVVKQLQDDNARLREALVRSVSSCVTCQ